MGQGMNRVLDSAAIHARVEIMTGSGDIDLQAS